MKNRLLIATATMALLAGTSLATAQDKKEGAAPAPAAQQTAPAEKVAPPAAAQNAPAARPDVKVDSKGSAQAPTSATERKVEGKTDTKADVKASESKPNAKPDAKVDAKTEAKPDAKAQNSAETKTPDAAKDSAKPATTTGQGAAGSTGARANLTTEQKTTIKTVIREQKVAPVTNVNFSISVGTRIPREVRYYPLPPRVISVYPQWRGYEYILVRDEILVIDPRTREIVAVIEA